MSIKAGWPEPNQKAPRVHQLTVMLAAERVDNRVVSEQYAKSLGLPKDMFDRVQGKVIEMMEVELAKAQTEIEIGQSIDDDAKQEEEVATQKETAKAARAAKKAAKD